MNLARPADGLLRANRIKMRWSTGFAVLIDIKSRIEHRFTAIAGSPSHPSSFKAFVTVGSPGGRLVRLYCFGWMQTVAALQSISEVAV